MENPAPHEPAADSQTPPAAPPSRPRPQPRQAHLQPVRAPAFAAKISAANPPTPRPQPSESPAYPCAVQDAHAWPLPRQSPPAPSLPGKSSSKSRLSYPAPGSTLGSPRGNPSPAHPATHPQAAFACSLDQPRRRLSSGLCSSLQAASAVAAGSRGCPSQSARSGPMRLGKSSPAVPCPPQPSSDPAPASARPKS